MVNGWEELTPKQPFSAAYRPSKAPALIVIDGFEYEVKQRAPWQNGLIPHYMYYVVRKYDG